MTRSSENDTQLGKKVGLHINPRDKGPALCVDDEDHSPNRPTAADLDNWS